MGQRGLGKQRTKLTEEFVEFSKCEPGQFTTERTGVSDDRWYMYLGDQTGLLKVFDLTQVIKASGSVKQAKPVHETNPKYFPTRKEVLDASSYAQHVREDAITLTDKTLDCEEIRLRMVLAHDKACTSVAGNEVCGIITCSRLGHDLKVWNPKTLDLWIHINQLKTLPDPHSSHPNPVVDKQIELSVS